MADPVDPFEALEKYLQMRLELPQRRTSLAVLGVPFSEIRIFWERDFWRELALKTSQNLRDATHPRILEKRK